MATGTSRQRSRRRRRGVSSRTLVCRRSPGWTRLLHLGRRLCPALAWGLEGPLRFHNAMRPSSPIMLPRLCPRLPRRTWRTTLAERRRAALSRGRLCRLRCPPAAPASPRGWGSRSFPGAMTCRRSPGWLCHHFLGRLPRPPRARRRGQTIRLSHAMRRSSPITSLKPSRRLLRRIWRTTLVGTR